MPRVATGIEELDRMLNGGFVRGMPYWSQELRNREDHPGPAVLGERHSEG